MFRYLEDVEPEILDGVEYKKSGSNLVNKLTSLGFAIAIASSISTNTAYAADAPSDQQIYDDMSQANYIQVHFVIEEGETRDVYADGDLTTGTAMERTDAEMELAADILEHYGIVGISSVILKTETGVVICDLGGGELISIDDAALYDYVRTLEVNYNVDAVEMPAITVSEEALGALADEGVVSAPKASFDGFISPTSVMEFGISAVMGMAMLVVSVGFALRLRQHAAGSILAHNVFHILRTGFRAYERVQGARTNQGTYATITSNPTQNPNWTWDANANMWYDAATDAFYDPNTGATYQGTAGSIQPVQQQQQGVHFGFGNSRGFHVDFHF